ncbi:MAG: hypothetical protein JSV49_02025 [Thermoplasmata archaeon]|nr:MAG: hypothetical protein JSV49_02025 [Thermoplasmata archaeon]
MTSGYSDEDSMPPPPPPDMRWSAPPVRRKESIKGYVIMILVGIIILLVGGIVYVLPGFLDDPMQPEPSDFSSTEDYQEAAEEYREDREDYQDRTRLIQTIGLIIQYVGLMVFAIGMVLGALTDEDLSQYTKLGMLVAMGIIIGLKIGSSTIYYWFM